MEHKCTWCGKYASRLFCSNVCRQLTDLCEKHRISEGMNTCDKPFEDDLEILCQEIAREARSDWTLELPDLPWFQIKAFNEERAEWWSPIYDTTNLPVELTQKPPQPPQGDSEKPS